MIELTTCVVRLQYSLGFWGIQTFLTNGALADSEYVAKAVTIVENGEHSVKLSTCGLPLLRCYVLRFLCCAPVEQLWRKIMCRLQLRFRERI